jgi:small subunit ribosomal protein S6
MSALNHYELMVIYTPVLSTEELKTSTQALTAFITTNGGTIIGEDAWGLKPLAYPIQKKTTALYHIVEYATETSINHKFETQMNRDENILRHIITALDKHAVAYNDRKRKGIKIAPKAQAKTETETTEA